MVNWDVSSAKFSLKAFYWGADLCGDTDQDAVQWIAENSEKFFELIDKIKQQDGLLSGQELQVLFKANAELVGDNSYSRKGIARIMHPVIEQMGLATMQYGPINLMLFKSIMNATFLQFAPTWGVVIPPTGLWGMQNVQHVEFHAGGMQPGIQIQANTPFGMNMSVSSPAVVMAPPVATVQVNSNMGVNMGVGMNVGMGMNMGGMNASFSFN